MGTIMGYQNRTSTSSLTQKGPFSLPSEPMSYKKQRQEAELVTKLRIIKLVESGYPQTQVAEKFHCHRNTVGNIVRAFRTLPEPVKKELLSSPLPLARTKELMAPLKNGSTRPHSHPAQATPKQEEAVVEEFEETNVGPWRMQTHLERKYHDSKDPLKRSLADLKIGKIRGIYKRKELKIKKKRRMNGGTIPLYDYRALAFGEYLHYDTKEIIDQKSLTEDIYHLFNQGFLPRYQWTLIDARSRLRFLAYSHELNSEFGLRFLIFGLQFIRAMTNNWQTHITVGQDNGLEFCSGSVDKEGEWNKALAPLNAHLYSYHVGHDVRKNLIERSHRIDDEELYVPRGKHFTSQEAFLKEAQDFLCYYNGARPHTGIAMDRKTPLEVIENAGVLGADRLLDFPVLLLEKNIGPLRRCTQIVELEAERQAYFAQSGSFKMDPKEWADLKSRLPFLDLGAQNVLTYYPTQICG